jgi:hypothetical protein
LTPPPPELLPPLLGGVPCQPPPELGAGEPCQVLVTLPPLGGEPFQLPDDAVARPSGCDVPRQPAPVRGCAGGAPPDT